MTSYNISEALRGTVTIACIYNLKQLVMQTAFTFSCYNTFFSSLLKNMFFFLNEYVQSFRFIKDFKNIYGICIYLFIFHCTV